MLLLLFFFSLFCSKKVGLTATKITGNLNQLRYVRHLLSNSSPATVGLCITTPISGVVLEKTVIRARVNVSMLFV